MGTWILGSKEELYIWAPWILERGWVPWALGPEWEALMMPGSRREVEDLVSELEVQILQP